MTSSMDLEVQYCARNYHPLPVVLARGEVVFVRDDAGNKCLDMMSWKNPARFMRLLHRNP